MQLGINMYTFVFATCSWVLFMNGNWVRERKITLRCVCVCTCVTWVDYVIISDGKATPAVGKSNKESRPLWVRTVGLCRSSLKDTSRAEIKTLMRMKVMKITQVVMMNAPKTGLVLSTWTKWNKMSCIIQKSASNLTVFKPRYLWYVRTDD